MRCRSRRSLPKSRNGSERCKPIVMDKLQIQGGTALEGEVRISGAKNATLPILAGALLAEDPVMEVHERYLCDFTTTVELLGRMGTTATYGERLSLEVDGMLDGYVCAPSHPGNAASG